MEEKVQEREKNTSTENIIKQEWKLVIKRILLNHRASR